MRGVAAVAGAAGRNHDGQILFAGQVCAAPAGEGVAALFRGVQCDFAGFHGVGVRVAGSRASVQVIRDGIGIARPLRGERLIFRGHCRRDCWIPASEGIAELAGIFGGCDERAVVLRDGCNGAAAIGVKGDGVLIDRPLRPICPVPCFVSADFRNGVAGQHLVIVPAGKGIALAGRIVCRRKRCALAIVVRGDIAAADRTAVCVQRHGISQGCPLRCQGSYTGGDHRSGDIALPIAAQPPEIAVGVAVRPGQTLAAGGGEAFAVLYNDIHRACGVANAAAV